MLSLSGLSKALKHQLNEFAMSADKAAALHNMANLADKIVREYAVDVLYEVPQGNIILNNHEKKKYSQFNEDGITEKIFDVIGHTDKFYLDFGGTEDTNNSEILHKEHGYKGVLWNGGDIDCQYAKVHKEYITEDNILSLCDKYDVPKEFDFLSIDIDGNDWYIWKKMCEERCRPRVVVIEYNATFPPPVDKVVVYKEEFNYDLTIYHSGSIQAMYNLGRKLGYSMVAAESSGYNLFFIRDDVLKEHDVFHGTNDCQSSLQDTKVGPSTMCAMRNHTHGRMS